MGEIYNAQCECGMVNVKNCSFNSQILFHSRIPQTHPSKFFSLSPAISIQPTEPPSAGAFTTTNGQTLVPLRTAKRQRPTASSRYYFSHATVWCSKSTAPISPTHSTADCR
ncbi:hypothetical protein Fot_35127 [Forsythia ovata]|uniref:Uncharacterized protein n=1 Tax=Forsythia ovata TaxID=205694 RepID=A0ABD1SNF2_9LAMI